MGVSTTTAAQIPASVYERCKKHLRITADTETDVVRLYLEGAVNDAETYTSRALWNTTFLYTRDCFPSSRTIILPRSPAVSVTSVKYYDEDGTLQTFASSNYYVANNDQLEARIVLKEDSSWPDLESGRPEAVEITFIAGYGTLMEDIPGMLLNGIILYAGHIYDNRNVDWKGVGASAKHFSDILRERLFSRYKTRWLK